MNKNDQLQTRANHLSCSLKRREKTRKYFSSHDNEGALDEDSFPPTKHTSQGDSGRFTKHERNQTTRKRRQNQNIFCQDQKQMANSSVPMRKQRDDVWSLRDVSAVDDDDGISFISKLLTTKNSTRSFAARRRAMKSIERKMMKKCGGHLEEIFALKNLRKVFTATKKQVDGRRDLSVTEQDIEQKKTMAKNGRSSTEQGGLINCGQEKEEANLLCQHHPSGEAEASRDCRFLDGLPPDEFEDVEDTDSKSILTHPEPKSSYKIVSRNDLDKDEQEEKNDSPLTRKYPSIQQPSAHWPTDQGLSRSGSAKETRLHSSLSPISEKEAKIASSILDQNRDNDTQWQIPPTNYCQLPTDDLCHHLRAGGGVKRYKDVCCGTSAINLVESARPTDSSVQLVIAKRSYYVNRNILIKHSNYFKTHPEIHRGVPISVDVPLKGRGWRQVHTWLTTDTGIVLNVKNVTHVYDVAKKLRMPKLETQCVQFVNEYLSDPINDPMPMLDNIRMLGEEELYSLAHQTTSKFTEHLFKSMHFLNYRVDQVCNTLNDDLLAVKSEKSVFDVAVLWLTYKWPQRSCDVSRVMGCVRFGLMTEDELLLCTIDDKGKCVLDTPFCQAMFLRAFQYLAAVDIGCEMMVPHLAPRPRAGTIPADMSETASACSSVDISPKSEQVHEGKGKVLKGTRTLDMTAGEDYGQYQASELNIGRQRSCGDHQVGHEPQYHDVRRQLNNQAATKIQSLFRGYRIRNTLQDLHSAAQVIQQCYRKNQNQHGKLISPVFSLSTGYALLTFGQSNNERSGDVILRYDINRNSWDKVMQTKLKINNFAATFLHNKIYITGGLMHTQFNKSIVLTSARYLDLTNAKWNQVASMLTPRMQHSLLSCNNKLYAIGGFGSRKTCLSSIECYDPGHNTWTTMCPMPKPKAASASAVYRHHLWICGGVINPKDNPRQTPSITDQVDCYDVLRNYWYKQNPLPLPLCYSLAVVSSDTLHVVGGRHTLADVHNKKDDGLSKKVFSFDYLHEKWLEKEDSLKARCKAAGAAVGDEDKFLYMFGGVQCPQASECYCFNTRHWFKITNSPLHISNPACIVIPPTKSIQIQKKSK